MPASKWSDKYLTGHAAVDTQHKRLFDLIDELQKAILSKQYDAKMQEKILGEVAAYATMHFRTEEQMMQKQGYPNYQRHLAKHQDLSRQVTEIIANVKAGKAYLNQGMVQFLSKWITEHIDGEDMEMIRFVQGKKVA